MLFGESYLGRRVFDLLRVMQLLVANGAAQPLSLSGRGSGSMIALFAAMMAGPVAGLSVERLSLRNMPTSCQDWASTAVCHWPVSCSLNGLLAVGDVADCYAALRAQGVVVKVSVAWDAMMMPTTGAATRATDCVVSPKL